MPSLPENVKIGACTVTFAGVDLGLTKGGVDVEVTTETYKIEVDQFGTTAIKEIVMGRNASAKTPLAESTLETIVKLIPGGTLITDAVTPTKKKIDVTTGVGMDLYSVADVLVLTPKDSVDPNETITFPRAATPGSFSFAFRHDAERIYEATWMAYPDLTTGELIVFGDTTATP